MLGQNIQELDTLQYSYKHLGETLSFDMLGRGEKVILISYAAKLTSLFLMTHPNSRLCTVKTQGNQMKMVEIDKDKAYETID